MVSHVKMVSFPSLSSEDEKSRLDSEEEPWIVNRGEVGRPCSSENIAGIENYFPLLTLFFVWGRFSETEREAKAASEIKFGLKRYIAVSLRSSLTVSFDIYLSQTAEIRDSSTMDNAALNYVLWNWNFVMLLWFL